MTRHGNVSFLSAHLRTQLMEITVYELYQKLAKTVKKPILVMQPFT